MGATDHAHLDGERADVGRAAAVETNAVFDHPGPHEVLEDRLEGPLRLGRTVGVVLGESELGDHRVEGLALGLAPGLLVGDRDHVAEPRLGGRPHPVEDLVRVVDGGRPLDLAGLDLRGEFELEVDRLGDVGLRRLEAGRNGVLVGRGVALGDQPDPVGSRSGLHHHDVDLALGVAASRHHELEDGLLEIVVGREGDPFALLEGEPHPADRPLEGDRAHGERGRRPVERHDVEWVLAVDGERHDDHLGLAAEAVGERGAQGAVDEPAGQDGLLGRTALAAEERSGDLPGGVHPLLDVDREGEEVDALTHLLVGGGGDEHLGPAELRHDGPIGLSGVLAGAEGELLATDRTGNRDFGHGVSSVVGEPGPLPVVSPRRPRGGN